MNDRIIIDPEIQNGKPVKVQQVAEELGVQYVLEGSVQQSGNRIRVMAQLSRLLAIFELYQIIVKSIRSYRF